MFVWDDTTPSKSNIKLHVCKNTYTPTFHFVSKGHKKRCRFLQEGLLGVPAPCILQHTGGEGVLKTFAVYKVHCQYVCSLFSSASTNYQVLEMASTMKNSFLHHT